MRAKCAKCTSCTHLHECRANSYILYVCIFILTFPCASYTRHILKYACSNASNTRHTYLSVSEFYNALNTRHTHLCVFQCAQYTSYLPMRAYVTLQTCWVVEESFLLWIHMYLSREYILNCVSFE